METKEEIKNIISKVQDGLAHDCDKECKKIVDAAYAESKGYKAACHDFAKCLISNLENLY